MINPFHGQLLSNRKKQPIGKHAATWRDLKGIRLSLKKSVPKGYILYCPIYISSLKDKIVEMENLLVGARGQGWGYRVEGRWVGVQKGKLNGHCGEGSILYLDYGGGCMNLHMR